MSRALRVILGIGVAVGAVAAVAGFRHADQLRVATRALRNRELDVRVERGVVYRRLPDAVLEADTYTPVDGRRNHPAIVMLHGGAWRSGSKEQVADIATPMARQGFVVVVPNYRLAPAHLWPAQLDDARAAVRWTRDNAAALSVAPGRIAAIGFSAGAQLAAVLGVRGRTGPDAVQAVVAVSGPYDFDRFAEQPDADYFAYWLGGTYRQRPRAYLEATPMRQIRAGAAPFLLIHGTDDELVLPRNDRLLADALRKSNVPVEVLEVRNAGHVLEPTPGLKPSPSMPQVFLTAATFLERHLSGGSR